MKRLAILIGALFLMELGWVAAVSIPHVIFPYDLLWATEGNILEGGLRVRDGDFAGIYRFFENNGSPVFGYHPLTYMILGALLRIMPPSVVVTRWLAFGSFMAALGALWRFMPRGCPAAWRIGSLFVALNALIALMGLPTKGVVDPLLLLTCLLATGVTATGELNGPRAFLAGALAAAAFLAKQPGLVTGVLCGAFVLYRNRGAFLAFALGYGLFGVLPLIWLDSVSGGAYRLQCFVYMAKVPILSYSAIPLMYGIFFKSAGAALLIVLLSVGISGFRRPRSLFHLAGALLWIMALVPVVAKDGASVAYFAPAAASLALAMPAALEAVARRFGTRVAVLALTIALAISLWSLSGVVIWRIDEKDRVNGERLADMISAAPGLVLMDRHQGFLHEAGRRPEHDLSQIWFFENRLGLPAAAPLTRDLRARRYGLVLISGDYMVPEVREALEREYERSPEEPIVSNAPGRYYYKFVPWRLRADGDPVPVSSR